MIIQRCHRVHRGLTERVWSVVGVWRRPAVNHPTIMGLVEANMTALAWDEFNRNSLQWQATVSPATWVGIWTSGDTVRRDGLPGPWTWAFPALCTHRHAYPLVSLSVLAGVSFTENGVRIRPVPGPAGPADQLNYTTPLLAITFTKNRGGNSSGAVEPGLVSGPGVWSARYTLAAPAARLPFRFELDLSRFTGVRLVWLWYLPRVSTAVAPLPPPRLGLCYMISVRARPNVYDKLLI